MAGTKMLSAAGARNIQSRVRSGEPKKHPGRRSNLRQVQVAENADEAKETHAHGIRRPVVSLADSSKKHHHHSDLKKKESNESSGNVEKYEPSREHQRPRRSKSLIVKRERIQDSFDEMKQRSKSGVDRMTHRSTKMLQHQKPSIRLRSKGPKSLPSRALFQHRPRTWFGSKKEEGNKVEEDWRNARPSAVKKPGRKEESKQDFKRSSTMESDGKSLLAHQRPSSTNNEGAVKKPSKKEEHHGKYDFKRSSTIESDGKSLLTHQRPDSMHHQGTGKKPNGKEEHNDNKQDLNGRSSTAIESDHGHHHQRPVGRSRSAPSKATFATEDEDDWRQYLACSDGNWFDM